MTQPPIFIMAGTGYLSQKATVGVREQSCPKKKISNPMKRFEILIACVPF